MITQTTLSILFTLVGLAASAFVVKTFFNAGKFKLTGDKPAFAAAQFGWAEKTPLGAIRFLGLLEVLGAIGSIIAPIAAIVTGQIVVQLLGVASAAGLALTMVAAMILHQIRGESKYTLKMNLKLFVPSVVAAAAYALVVLPVTF